MSYAFNVSRVELSGSNAGDTRKVVWGLYESVMKQHFTQFERIVLLDFIHRLVSQKTNKI
jgi:hypothetical protein